MVVVGPYDTTKIVLIRYAVEDGNALPNFFRIQNSETVSVGDTEIDIEDFRVLSRKYTIRQIDQVIVLARSFSLPLSDALCLWIESSKIKLKVPDFLILRTFSRDFHDEDRYKQTLARFNKKITQTLDFLRKKLTTIDNLVATLGLPPKEEPSFSIDGEEIDLTVSVSEVYGLMDIFDRISVSANLPFISCTLTGRTFFKVHDLVRPPKSWIDSAMTAGEGIFLQVYTSSTLTSLDEAYATAIWRSNNIISVNYRTRKAKDVKERIKAIIYESLDRGERPNQSRGDEEERYKLDGLTISGQRSVFISGIFSYKMDYNPYVLAHLVSLDDLVTRFAFLNETERTEPNKRMFRLYLNLGRSVDEYSTADSIQINIFAIAKETESLGIYKLRIRHCTDILTAKASIRLFARLYQEYEARSKSIYEFYSQNKLAAKIVESARNKTRVKAADQKTKARLISLKNYDLALFGSGYSGQCQSNKQPYIVAKARDDGRIPDEVLALRKQFEGSDNADKKIMLFDGHYYASEIPGGKSTHKFPGLKPNKDTSTKSSTYREDYPCLPCSFTKPKDYVLPDREVSAEECIRDKASKGDTGGDYISETKPPGPGKLSDMPFNLAKLATLVGLTRNIEGKGKKRNKHFPYLRYGLPESPHSFILALEAATNFERFSKTLDRASLVRKALEGMINKFPAGRQELYDTTFVRLRRIFVNEWEKNSNKYIDPASFVSLAEAYYEINIVMFTMEESGFLGDEFLMPRYVEAALPKKYSEGKKTVVIIRQRLQNEAWPYQCCILRKLELQGKKQVEISLFDKEDAFIEKIKEMYHRYWTVYSTSPEGYFKYDRSIELFN